METARLESASKIGKAFRQQPIKVADYRGNPAIVHTWIEMLFLYQSADFVGFWYRGTCRASLQVSGYVTKVEQANPVMRRRRFVAACSLLLIRLFRQTIRCYDHAPKDLVTSQRSRTKPSVYFRAKPKRSDTS
jgi:hypothetical protein